MRASGADLRRSLHNGRHALPLRHVVHERALARVHGHEHVFLEFIAVVRLVPMLVSVHVIEGFAHNGGSKCPPIRDLGRNTQARGSLTVHSSSRLQNMTLVHLIGQNR